MSNVWLEDDSKTKLTVKSRPSFKILFTDDVKPSGLKNNLLKQKSSTNGRHLSDSSHDDEDDDDEVETGFEADDITQGETIFSARDGTSQQGSVSSSAQQGSVRSFAQQGSAGSFVGGLDHEENPIKIHKSRSNVLLIPGLSSADSPIEPVSESSSPARQSTIGRQSTVSYGRLYTDLDELSHNDALRLSAIKSKLITEQRRKSSINARGSEVKCRGCFEWSPFNPEDCKLIQCPYTRPDDDRPTFPYTRPDDDRPESKLVLPCARGKSGADIINEIRNRSLHYNMGSGAPPAEFISDNITGKTGKSIARDTMSTSGFSTPRRSSITNDKGSQNRLSGDIDKTSSQDGSPNMRQYGDSQVYSHLASNEQGFGTYRATLPANMIRRQPSMYDDGFASQMSLRLKDGEQKLRFQRPITFGGNGASSTSFGGNNASNIMNELLKSAPKSNNKSYTKRLSLVNDATKEDRRQRLASAQLRAGHDSQSVMSSRDARSRAFSLRPSHYFFDDQSSHHGIPSALHHDGTDHRKQRSVFFTDVNELDMFDPDVV